MSGSQEAPARICLVNMPFAALANPSLALTQLHAAVRGRLGERVRVELLYLNQEFARGVGFELYERLANSDETHGCGLGDWLFRQAAFPNAADNADEYFARYIPASDERSIAMRRDALAFRARIDGLLDAAIDEHALDAAAVVGFTSMFFQQTASFALARRIKSRNPAVLTAVGGATCETPMGEQIARHVDAVDYVFSGPALIGFPELVERVADGAHDPARGIDGVFARGAGSAAAPLGRELPIDRPLPLDYDDFLDALDRNLPGRDLDPHLMFETSRGCWWGERSHCTFCGLNGLTMAHRTMPPDQAVRQFEALFRYASRASYFAAVDNLLPKEYVAEVFPRIRPPEQATLFYEVKASLSAEELAVLAKARVRRVQPGIESLATSTLKLMRKGTTAFHNIRFLKNCLQLGIEPVWNLLVGFPGEGDDVYRKYLDDLPLMTHLFPPTGAWPVRFDRYSPYFSNPQDYGLDLRPMDFYRLVYPFPDESLADLAYYFSDHNFEARYLSALAPWLGPIRKPIETWQQQWSRGGAAAPRLCFAPDDPDTVIDSRSGAPVRHPLGAHGAEALRLLDEPSGPNGLGAALGDRPGFDPEREIAALAARGLLFREGERYLSLVTTPAPCEASPGAELKAVRRQARRRAGAARAEGGAR